MSSDRGVGYIVASAMMCYASSVRNQPVQRQLAPAKRFFQKFLDDLTLRGGFSGRIEAE